MQKLPPFDPELLKLPNYELGIQAWAWWVVAQAEELGIWQKQLTPEIAEFVRLKTLSLNTNNENLTGLEKALQVIAWGVDIARGGKMFRDHMNRQAMTIALVDEAKTGRRRQRVNAKKSRTDALQGLIADIMARRREITPDGLLTELRKHEHGPVIQTIDDERGVIEWTNKYGRIKDTPFSGLKDKMSWARKKLPSC